MSDFGHTSKWAATVEGLCNYLDALHSVQYIKNSPTEICGHNFKYIAHCAAYYGLWDWMVFLALKYGSNILPRYDTETWFWSQTSDWE